MPDTDEDLGDFDAPDNTDQPVATPTAPPGDFTTGAFWESPSTYLALSSYLLPLLSLIFHKDFSVAAKAISEFAPIFATGVLMLMRNLHKREVIKANAQLALQRLGQNHELQVTMMRELVGKLSAAEAKKLLTTGETIKLPLAA